MPARRPMLVDRLVVLTIAAFSLFVAVELHHLNGRDGVTVFHGLMPPWFAVAGVLCIVFAATWDRRVMQLAGAFTTVAYASRVVGVACALAEGTLVLPKELAAIHAAGWTLLTVLVAHLWVRLFRPIAGYVNARRR